MAIRHHVKALTDRPIADQPPSHHDATTARRIVPSWSAIERAAQLATPYLIRAIGEIRGQSASDNNIAHMPNIAIDSPASSFYTYLNRSRSVRARTVLFDK